MGPWAHLQHRPTRRLPCLVDIAAARSVSVWSRPTATSPRGRGDVGRRDQQPARKPREDLPCRGLAGRMPREDLLCRGLAGCLLAVRPSVFRAGAGKRSASLCHLAVGPVVSPKTRKLQDRRHCRKQEAHEVPGRRLEWVCMIFHKRWSYQ